MSFFQNTCKPEGLAGRLMVSMMNAGHTPMAKWGFSHIQVPNDAACLDIGCGGGANLRRLLEKCPQGHVTGIDHSAVSVEKSRKAARAAIGKGRCTVLRGNVMALPFDEGAFDLVTAFDTELQLKSLKKILIARRAWSSYETCFVISFLINHKTGSAVRRCLPD